MLKKSVMAAVCGLLRFMTLFIVVALSGHAMTYRPEKVNLGDTWVFYHNGTYYLYYLVATEWGPWDGFALATSTDGVHWKETDTLFRKSDNATWQGSGSVWKSPNFAKDGKFQCNFSEEPRGDAQHIYFAESTDLIHWTRLDGSYEFRQDPRWYVEKGRWDCIYTIPRPGGGLYGYWTATPRDFTGFGFGETLDGTHWKALAPPHLDWGGNPDPKGCELGAVERIAGRYYAMVGGPVGDGRLGGMVTFVGDAPQGPFRAAPRNFILLVGDCYFARFFPSPDGMLVTHQSITHDRRKTTMARDLMIGNPRLAEIGFTEERLAPVCYVAPLKRALVDAQGVLRLGYWTGNEKLKGPAVPVKTPGRRRDTSLIAFLDQQFDVSRGVVLEGTVALPAAGSAPLPGLYLEADDGTAAAVKIGPGGVVEAGTIRRDGSGFVSRFKADRETSFGRTARFRLLLRHSLLEFYLDDILFQVYSLPGWATGRIGLLDGGSGIGNLKAWTMTLPALGKPSTGQQ